LPISFESEHYNHVRLNGVIGVIAPTDRIAGRQGKIHAGCAKTAADSSPSDGVKDDPAPGYLS